MDQVLSFKNLIAGFKKIPPFKAPAPTLMEIAGFPHYENVCSNILAFYFDPTQPHGFSDMMLKSLLQGIAMPQLLNEIGTLAYVQREELTAQQKRIDLVLATSTCVIAIENKIHAGLYNDLDSYSRHLSQRYSDRPLKIKIVLSLSPISGNISAGFTGITYNTFFSCLKNNIGNYITGANTKYLAHLTDFVHTIENLNKMIEINPDVLAFFRENKDQVEALLEANKQVRNLILQKIYQLQGNLAEQPASVKQWIWQKYVLVHDFNLGKAVVAVDTVIDVEGIIICVWVRTGNVDKREFLKKLSYFHKNPVKAGDWRGDRIDVVKKEQMPFTATAAEIAEKVNSVLTEIYIVKEENLSPT